MYRDCFDRSDCSDCRRPRAVIDERHFPHESSWADRRDSLRLLLRSDRHIECAIDNQPSAIPHFALSDDRLSWCETDAFRWEETDSSFRPHTDGLSMIRWLGRGGYWSSAKRRGKRIHGLFESGQKRPHNTPVVQRINHLIRIRILRLGVPRGFGRCRRQCL